MEEIGFEFRQVVGVAMFVDRQKPRVRGGIHLDAKTSKRYNAVMAVAKRATVYFQPRVHRALRMKAAVDDRSISDVVNDAVGRALAEDAEDLKAFDDTADEPFLDFEDFVKSLRRRGKI